VCDLDGTGPEFFTTRAKLYLELFLKTPKQWVSGLAIYIKKVFS